MSYFKEEISIVLSHSEAAAYLEVSEATLRNWLRAGVVESLDIRSIKHLKSQVELGSISRLNKRANKNHNDQKHSHRELIQNEKNAALLTVFLRQSVYETKEILFAGFLKLLEFHQVKIDQKLNHQLKEWELHSQMPSIQSIMFELDELELDWSENFLNFIYQTHIAVGGKQRRGAYYTPIKIVKNIIANTIHVAGTFLDPCCGGGHFLLEAYRHLKVISPRRAHQLIYGVDCDPIAVLIARAVLTLESKGVMDVVAQIRVGDSLIKSFKKVQFDTICTNPPWGAHLSTKVYTQLNLLHPEIKSQESYSYFIASSLQYLKNEGELSFVLPISFMNVKMHKDIRNLLLQKYQITSIDLIEDKFSGVFTKSLILSVRKIKPRDSDLIKINGQSYTRAQILKNKDQVFPQWKNKREERIITKMESGEVLRLDQSEWALGIVTGDNQKFLSTKNNRSNHAIIKGSDIRRFSIDTSTQFIKFEKKKLQQTAPIEKYLTSPKLVYRFICKEWVFAIDRSESFTLNSANILIPKIEGYSIESVCGILNSKVAQFYFQAKFHSVKVLRSHLEQFPFPPISARDEKRLSGLVKRLEKSFSHELYAKLNQLIMELYSLDEESKSEVESVSLSQSFMPLSK